MATRGLCVPLRRLKPPPPLSPSRRYNKLAGLATRLVALLNALKPDDPFRIKVTDQMLEKLYAFGAIPTRSSIKIVEKLSTSSFAKRRLPVIMVRTKMCETLKEAVTFVEQVRAGRPCTCVCFCVQVCVCVHAGPRARGARGGDRPGIYCHTGHVRLCLLGGLLQD